jgi:hypothetical protein
MRIVNRLLAAILALAIAGAGLLTAVEVLVAQTNWATPPLLVPYDQWLTTLLAHAWKDTPVLLISIGVIVVGLLLILAAAADRDRSLRMIFTRPEIHASTSRRSLARALENEAAAVDGVGSAKAKVRRRKARVNAQIRIGDPDVISETLRTAIAARLRQLPLQNPPEVRIHVAGPRRRT